MKGARDRRWYLCIAATAAVLLAACSGGGGDNGTASNSGLAGTATSQPTSQPTLTEAPTPTPTEKPYGPAPTPEELKASITATYAKLGLPVTSYINQQFLICTGQQPPFTFDTKVKNDATNLVTSCFTLAEDLKRAKAGSGVDISDTLKLLGNTYFSGIEKFASTGVLSSSNLSKSSVERDTLQYFTQK